MIPPRGPGVARQISRDFQPLPGPGWQDVSRPGPCNQMLQALESLLQPVIELMGRAVNLYMWRPTMLIHSGAYVRDS
jgi:hypothetical protein